MPRSVKGAARRRAKNRILKSVKGYRGARGTLYRVAKSATRRAAVNSYAGRRQKKRHFRRLWIARLNAACRAQGITYSRFIAGLKKENVDIDRNMLSSMAIEDPESFTRLVELAKKAG